MSCFFKSLIACLFIVSFYTTPSFSKTLFEDCEKPYFCIIASSQQKQVILSIESFGRTPFTINIAPEAENLSGNQEAKSFFIRKKMKKKIFTFKKPRTGKWYINYFYSSHIGITEHTHDDSAIYLLPFKPQATFKMTQGYNSLSTHEEETIYSLDWGLPIGTDIYASRGGRVIGTKHDSNEGGPSSSYGSKANYIWIEHNDKTVGVYLHLMKDGVFVHEGDYVEAGDLVGKSGNTGYTHGPHLHFHVSTPTPNGPYAYKTIPVNYLTEFGVISGHELDAGEYYTNPVLPEDESSTSIANSR